jgi:hypothetical protein
MDSYMSVRLKRLVSKSKRALALTRAQVALIARALLIVGFFSAAVGISIAVPATIVWAALWHRGLLPVAVGLNVMLAFSLFDEWWWIHRIQAAFDKWSGSHSRASLAIRVLITLICFPAAFIEISHADEWSTAWLFGLNVCLVSLFLVGLGLAHRERTQVRDPARTYAALKRIEHVFAVTRLVVAVCQLSVALAWLRVPAESVVDLIMNSKPFSAPLVVYLLLTGLSIILERSEQNVSVQAAVWSVVAPSQTRAATLSRWWLFRGLARLDTFSGWLNLVIGPYLGRYLLGSSIVLAITVVHLCKTASEHS